MDEKPQTPFNLLATSWAYYRVIRWSLVVQLVVGFLAAFVLDGGLMARVFLVAAACYWLSVAIIMVRRPLKPTTLDLAFVQHGFWPMLAVAVLVQNFGGP